MAIPVLQLNLIPPPTVWRQNHELLGLSALAGGIALLALAGGLSIQKYVQAGREGKLAVSISAEAQKVAREQARVVEALQQVDAAERMPRYRLAERIYLERALPWSRLTAEMERSLQQDVRVRTISRVRASDGSVSLKVRGEAKSRAAESKFVESLQGNAMFTQVVFEREAERAGGGIDFDLSLPVSGTPPAFEPLPIPPPLKLDQFGRPLEPGAKVVRLISGARGGSAAPVPARPAVPAAQPAQAPAKPAPVAARPEARPAPAPVPAPPANPAPERVPVFNRRPGAQADPAQPPAQTEQPGQRTPPWQRRPRPGQPRPGDPGRNDG